MKLSPWDRVLWILTNSGGGIFSAIKAKFEGMGKKDILDTVDKIYSVLNEYIAHQEKELDDMNTAKLAMNDWVMGLIQISSIESQAG